jgi:hypothetical protein
MEISELAAILESVPSGGVFLSQLERLRICCSLRLLQNQMKAESVYFLGKILTLGSNYYLSFSTEVNKYMPAIYFCSQDAITWFSIATVPSEAAEEIIQHRTPLTGTLTSEVTLPSGQVVNEELRLAALVSDIAQKCLLVPRGFLVKTALNLVLLNPMWSGLPLDDCRKLSNFRHWRNRANEPSMLERALGNPATDFVEPLVDIETWSFVFVDAGVHFKSLRWPGFEFWINGTSFANLYFGFGLPELDLEQSIAPVLPHTERAAYLAQPPSKPI